jgi:hypothetical protein
VRQEKPSRSVPTRAARTRQVQATQAEGQGRQERRGPSLLLGSFVLPRSCLLREAGTQATKTLLHRAGSFWRSRRPLSSSARRNSHRSGKAAGSASGMQRIPWPTNRQTMAMAKRTRMTATRRTRTPVPTDGGATRRAWQNQAQRRARSPQPYPPHRLRRLLARIARACQTLPHARTSALRSWESHWAESEARLCPAPSDGGRSPDKKPDCLHSHVHRHRRSPGEGTAESVSSQVPNGGGFIDG